MISEVVTTLIIMLAIGLLAGFVGSILGIGGGLIVTPMLTTLMGLDIKYAIASSIIVVIATSSGSAIAYLKDDIINLRAAMFLEIFTTIGGLIGALITGIANPGILYAIFSVVLIFSVINMFFRIKDEKHQKLAYSKNDKMAIKLKLNSSYFDKSLKKNIEYKLCRVPLGCTIMCVAGIISGLLGIGSGIFKVIAMDGAMKMPLKPSSATSNLMMGVTAASSSIVYFVNGSILPEVTVPVIIGVLIGATLGTRIMPKLPTFIIRILFIIVMSIFFTQMLMKAIAFF